MRTVRCGRCRPTASCGPHTGPNALRRFEQSLAAVADLDIATEQQLELISLVDDYTFGYLLRSANPERAADNDQITAAISYIDQQIQTGRYPHINGLIGDGNASSGWEQITAIIGDENRYERGLQRLLDGFEQHLSIGTETDANPKKRDEARSRTDAH
jgi:hypothetical protein